MASSDAEEIWREEGIRKGCIEKDSERLKYARDREMMLRITHIKNSRPRPIFACVRLLYLRVLL